MIRMADRDGDGQVTCRSTRILQKNKGETFSVLSNPLCHKNSSMYSMYGHRILYSKNMDQPGMVANPARGQLNRET